MGKESSAKQAASPRKKAIAWFAAALWAVCLFCLSFLPAQAASSLHSTAIDWILAAVKAILAVDLTQTALPIRTLVAGALMMGGFAILAVLLWLALRLSGAPQSMALLISLAGSVFFAAADEVCQLLVPGRMPLISDWLIGSAGALAALLVIACYLLLRVKAPGLVNRETTSYVVFGVLTTVVNILLFSQMFYGIRLGTILSNTIAWVGAVLFAYVVNRVFVFRSRAAGFKAIAREFLLFVGARLVSFVVADLFGMWLLIDVLHVGALLAKVAMNVIVLIMNYIFSKLVIFKKSKPAKPDGGTPL